MHCEDVPGQPAPVISPGRGPQARRRLHASVGKGHLDLKVLEMSLSPTELLPFSALLASALEMQQNHSGHD